LEEEGDVKHLQLLGSATFLRLPNLARALDEVERGSELHIHLDRLAYIDHACFDLINDWSKQHEKSGGKLCIDWELLQSRFLSDPSLEVRSVVEKRISGVSSVVDDSSAPQSLSSWEGQNSETRTPPKFCSWAIEKSVAHSSVGGQSAILQWLVAD